MVRCIRLSVSSHANPVASLRVQKNLNQHQLAEAAGVSSGYVSALESGRIDSPGRRNQEAFNKIAAALDCDPGELRRMIQDFQAA